MNLKLRISCPLFAFIILSLACENLPAADSAPIPGQFVVKLKKSSNSITIQQALSDKFDFKKFVEAVRVGGKRGADNFEQIYVVYDSTNSQSLAEISLSIGQDNIEYIEPVYPLEFFEIPADSLLHHQWYLHNNGQEYYGIQSNDGIGNDSLVLKTGTAGKDINLLPFYNNPPSESTKVVVGIVDTGVDTDHPELLGKIWRNPDEIAGNGIDDDHNGFIDDIVGYDVSGDEFTFLDPVGDNDPSDSVGHGTHIAGIVASSTNGRGVVGVSPAVEIMAVKIRPNATTAVGAAGIVYAVIAGAKVINISWGTPFEAGILRDALNFARNNGVFVGIAAGNSGDNERFYPAAFDSAFVVAAGNSDGFMTDFSTFGAHIDIVAPGEDILSLRASGTDMYASGGEPGVRIIGADSLYYLSDGTSMSTPVVVGTAAMLWSIRPDLSLGQMEDIIRMGAIDLVDPLDRGDSLVGPDTLSGFGCVDAATSFNLLANGGIRFLEPTARNRYTGDFEILVAPVAGYNGSWKAEFKFEEGDSDWQLLNQGTLVNSDTVSLIFSSTSESGNLHLRLTDQFGNGNSVAVVYVRDKVVEISFPTDNQELKYTTPIFGSIYGLDFDSMAVFTRKQGSTLTKITSSTGEYFDSLLVTWSVSGIDTGNFTLYAHGYFAGGLAKDSVKVHVSSAFAPGWPRAFGGFPAMSPNCGDVDGDGKKELIVGVSNGLHAFRYNGTAVSGFPVLRGKDVRCVPALYDLDDDDKLDIICTTADGIHAFKFNGQSVDGWPVEYYTGTIPYGFGFPNPTVGPLGNGQDSVVMIINKRGQILAYNFDGTPYFHSLGGLFASFDPRVTDFLSYGGQSSPFITSTDINNDGVVEIIGAYSSLAFPYEGVGLFESTTGRPAFGGFDELVLRIPTVLGTILADLDRDMIPEIISTTIDSGGVPRIWALKNGTEVLPGWPVSMPDVTGWIGSYPTAADLDLDGLPEVLCTFFEFDIAALYIFRADGSSYLPRDGRPVGEALFEPVTFGVPTVANVTGDEHPEILIRSGHILPGSGPEKLYIFDYLLEGVSGWPQRTPARPNSVVSSRYPPLVDDIDGDGQVEVVLLSDANQLLVWKFEASFENGRNTTKFLVDSRNSGIVRSPDITTDIGDDIANELPRSFVLNQNYPNPFNPGTTIEFSLPERSQAKLEVYNILGQKVQTLADEELSTGVHKVVFNAEELSSGIYFYRLTSETTVLTRKMTLVK